MNFQILTSFSRPHNAMALMEMWHRLAGVKYVSAGVDDAAQIHGNPKATGTLYNQMIERLNCYNRAYWLSKWGNEDYFGTPLTQPNPISSWTLNTERRFEMIPIFNEFINNPTPSLYT